MAKFKTVKGEEFEFQDGVIGFMALPYIEEIKASVKEELKFSRLTVKKLTVFGEWGDGVMFEMLGHLSEPIPELPEFTPKLV